MTASGGVHGNAAKPSLQRNNGLVKTKYLTFGVDAESIQSAKPRLERIETDLLNHFKRLGVSAAPSQRCGAPVPAA